ncbi:MAG TPA: transposase [Trueperaceae bacterium]
MRKRRRYTDNDRATALAVLDSNGGNIARTARETGISQSTLRDWRDDPHPDTAELRDQKRAALSDLWEEVARAYIARALDHAAVNDTTAQSAVTVAAIATDKLQLLLGKPTEISKHEHERRETPAAALEAAAEELRRRGLVN